jgi:hypothetical protein
MPVTDKPFRAFLLIFVIGVLRPDRISVNREIAWIVIIRQEASVDNRYLDYGLKSANLIKNTPRITHTNVLSAGTPHKVAPRIRVPIERFSLRR